MNVMAFLRSSRGFWSVIGAGAVVVLLFLFGWALPVHREAQAQRGQYDTQLMMLRSFEETADGIPSSQSVRELKDFNDWVSQEAKNAKSFFGVRADMLDATIAGAEAAPEDFKAAYIDALQRRQDWIEQHRSEMRVVNESTAFPTYAWVRTAALPIPADYPEIRRRYWAHLYLYERFLSARVRQVNRVQLTDAFKVSERFNGQRFEAVVMIRPDLLDNLIDKVLDIPQPAAGPAGPSGPTGPAMQLEKIDVTRDTNTLASEPMIRVKLNGHILMHRPRTAGDRP